MASGLWTRIVTGDGLRKTRFHTISGAFVDLGGLAHLPRAIWSTVLWKGFGYRLHAPWLGYRAVAHLKSVIQPDWKVLEFGSGMSSLFLARHCGHLVSVESDPGWFEAMQARFQQLGVKNVDYRLRSLENYVTHDDLPDHSFDLAIVDGASRDREAATSVRKVKPGGLIFYDNSDVPWPEHQAARRLLLDAADPAIAPKYFNDFCPFQVQLNESMLIRTRSE